MSAEPPPTVTVVGNAIRVQGGGGTAGERIDVQIYHVGVGGDDPTAVFEKLDDHLDAGGNGTLTSTTLPAGRYHVVTTAYPPPAGSPTIVFNKTVDIPTAAGG